MRHIKICAHATVLSAALVLLMLGLTSNASGADKAKVAIVNPIRYGWLGNAQLSDLTPTRNRAPYDLLLNHHFEEAALSLQQELTQYPDSLAGYVGLMQARPERWQSEIKRLRREIAQQKSSHQLPKSADLFKLGTLLYYQWGQQPAPPQNKQSVAEAQSLLAHAWHDNHAPIVGLMLGDTLNDGVLSPDPLLKGLTAKIIYRKLLNELAGSKAYAQYLQAQKAEWKVEPPAVSLVSPKNIRPLLAVVATLRSASTRRSSTVQIVNGKIGPIVFDPVPAAQVSQQHYMEKWYQNLVNAIPAT